MDNSRLSKDGNESLNVEQDALDCTFDEIENEGLRIHRMSSVITETEVRPYKVGQSQFKERSN